LTTLVPSAKDVLQMLDSPNFKEVFRNAVSSRKVKLCTNCPDLKQFVAEQLGLSESIVEQYWKDVIFPKLREIYNRRDAISEKGVAFAFPIVTLANVLYFLLYEQTEEAPKIMYEILEPYVVRCLNSMRRDDCEPVRLFFSPVDSENVDSVLRLLAEILSKYPQLRVRDLDMICAVSAHLPKAVTAIRKNLKDVSYCKKELNRILQGGYGW